jgi:hypothetical protein
VDYQLYVSLVSDAFAKNRFAAVSRALWGIGQSARRGGEGHDRRLMAPRGWAVILVSARLRDLRLGV